MYRICIVGITLFSTVACTDDDASQSAPRTAVDVAPAPAPAVPPSATEPPASPAAEQPAALAGTAWLAEDIDGHGVIDTAQSTLEFLEVGKVAGRAGCNRFGGSVAISGPALQFTKLMSTKMACAPALMDQEARFLKALEAVRTHSFEGAQLILFDQAGQPKLRFSRHEEP